MSYTIYRRDDGPFFKWHYLVCRNLPQGFDEDLKTTWTLIGARTVVRRHRKQIKSDKIVVTRVESW